MDYVQVWVGVEERSIISGSSNQVAGLLKSAQEDFLEEVGRAVQRGADSRKNCHHFPHLSAQLCSAAVRSLSPVEHDLTTKG